MDLLKAIFLGIVQALTEYLPVSSSAHLDFFSQILSIPASVYYLAITQMGTELALLIYLRAKVWKILANWARSTASYLRFRRPTQQKPCIGELEKATYARLGWGIILATIPIGIVGLCFGDLIETYTQSTYVTVGCLILLGLVLALVDLHSSQTKDLSQLTLPQCLLIGVFQCLALVPGVSRSGITITAARILKLDRSSCVEFSFLLALPAVFLSGGYVIISSLAHADTALTYPLVSAVSSFLLGSLVLRLFLRYISTHSFLLFALYRVFFALVILGVMQG